MSCNLSFFYKGVLERQCPRVTVIHVKTQVCAMTSGLTISVSARALLLEATVPKVKKKMYLNFTNMIKNENIYG